MGLLESLLSAEWVRRQVMESPFEFLTFVAVLALTSSALGYRRGRAVGRRRADELSSEAERLRNEFEHERTRLVTQLEGERTRTMQVVGELARAVARQVVDEELQPLTFEEIDRILAETGDRDE